MAQVTADYPTSIWDGASSTRAAPVKNVDRSPDYEDWDKITAEVIATQTDLKAVDGDNLKTVADASVVGGVPVVHRINIADSSGDTDVVLTYKTRIIDVVIVKTAINGGSGDTITIKNGTSAITNSISVNITDTTIARAGTIDDSTHEIAAAGTLRVTAAKSTSVACIVYVHGIRVP